MIPSISMYSFIPYNPNILSTEYKNTTVTALSKEVMMGFICKDTLKFKYEANKKLRTIFIFIP